MTDWKRKRKMKRTDFLFICCNLTEIEALCGTPLQCSCLENPMDGGVWWAAVHGVAQSRTWLSNFTFPFHFHALEKEMATHSSVLAWRIPGTGEPGGLSSMGSHRVGHNWSDLAAAAAAASSFYRWGNWGLENEMQSQTCASHQNQSTSFENFYITSQ